MHHVLVIRPQGITVLKCDHHFGSLLGGQKEAFGLAKVGRVALLHGFGQDGCLLVEELLA